MMAITKTFAEQIVDLERGLRLFKRCAWAFVGVVLTAIATFLYVTTGGAR
jgi:uncharacterized membrane protein YczE